MELTALVIYGLIQVTIFLTPVVVIVYRQGKKDQMIIHLEAENKAIRQEVNNVGSKITNLQLNWENSLKVLTAKINNIEVDLGKIITTLEFLKDKDRS